MFLRMLSTNSFADWRISRLCCCACWAISAALLLLWRTISSSSTRAAARFSALAIIASASFFAVLTISVRSATIDCACLISVGILRRTSSRSSRTLSASTTQRPPVSGSDHARSISSSSWSRISSMDIKHTSVYISVLFFSTLSMVSTASLGTKSETSPPNEAIWRTRLELIYIFSGRAVINTVSAFGARLLLARAI